MTNKNFCLSSYIAYRYIYKEGIDFFEGMQHHNFIPINIAERIPVKTAHDIDIEIQKEFENISVSLLLSFKLILLLRSFCKNQSFSLEDFTTRCGYGIVISFLSKANFTFSCIK